MTCNPVRFQTARRSGFTIIELVTVLGILAVLLAIGFGFLSGRKEVAMISKAESEMQVIQIALEAYKTRFGDYPKIPASYDAYSSKGVDDPNSFLLNALCGKIGPTGAVLNNIPVMLNTASLRFRNPSLPYSEITDNWIIDPWETSYVYEYPRKGAESDLYGYKLYSLGPDTEISEDDIVAQ